MRKSSIIAAAAFAASILATVSAVSAGSITKAADQSTFERRGADDPKGHIRGEGIGHPVKADTPFTVARRGRGADDPKGHIRGEGVGHPVKAATVESIG